MCVHLIFTLILARKQFYIFHNIFKRKIKQWTPITVMVYALGYKVCLIIFLYIIFFYSYLCISYHLRTINFKHLILWFRQSLTATKLVQQLRPRFHLINFEFYRLKGRFYLITVICQRLTSPD